MVEPSGSLSTRQLACGRQDCRKTERNATQIERAAGVAAVAVDRGNAKT